MPKAWGRVARAELDLRPGRIISIDITVGDGREVPNVGCVLEVVPMQRLVWTSMLFPGYRPAVFDDIPIPPSCTGEHRHRTVGGSRPARRRDLRRAVGASGNRRGHSTDRGAGQAGRICRVGRRLAPAGTHRRAGDLVRTGARRVAGTVWITDRDPRPGLTG